MPPRADFDKKGVRRKLNPLFYWGKQDVSCGLVKVFYVCLNCCDGVIRAPIHVNTRYTTAAQITMTAAAATPAAMPPKSCRTNRSMK